MIILAKSHISAPPLNMQGYFRKAQAVLGMGAPHQAYKYLTVGLDAVESEAERKTFLAEIAKSLSLANEQLTTELAGRVCPQPCLSILP